MNARLDQLHNLRTRIDQEIVRELRAEQRIRKLTANVRAGIATRGDYSSRVIAAAADHFGTSTAAITSTNRRRTATEARQVAAWLLRSAGRSYPEIGRVIGRDHSTVMSAVKRVEGDAELLADARTIYLRLTGEEEVA